MSFRGGGRGRGRGGFNKGPKPVTTKIFIGNLPETIRKGDLQEHLEEFGSVAEFDIIKNYAFAHYDNAEDAQAAVDGLNGRDIDGSGTCIRVQLSTSKVRQKPGMTEGQCYRCGDTGHWSKDCPQGPVIRDSDRGRGRGRGGLRGRGRGRGLDPYALDPYDDPYFDDPYYPPDPRDPYYDPYYRDRYLPPLPPRRYSPYADPYERRAYARDPYAYGAARDPRDPYARPPPEFYARRRADPYARPEPLPAAAYERRLPPRPRIPLGAESNGLGVEMEKPAPRPLAPPQYTDFSQDLQF